ncbi:hypothetical protein EPO44_01670 [bacterium]|nr:MAG: hypothetical protein EPO44_01670 [bacterium]
MAEITWTAEAQRWLEDIFEYIAADNPHVADLQQNRVRARLRRVMPDLILRETQVI